MLKIILGGVVAILLAFVAFVASRPSEFKIERSTSINASAPLVYPHVADFHKWVEWSPWEKLDADMKKTFEGPEYGVGSSYSWVGNDKVGEGRMTIMELRPTESVQVKLDFIKPWQATNTTHFLLQSPHPDATVVTWQMEGENNFMAKAFALFVNVDELVGKDFEQGLATLKTICEGEAEKAKAAAAAAAAPAPSAEPAPGSEEELKRAKSTIQ